jgi:uncharacterized OB-fold protein
VSGRPGDAAALDPPLPDLTERMAPFWSAAQRGSLVLQRCTRCSAYFFPAVETCSSCLASDALGWVDASGCGEVFSYVVMHQIYHPAFANDAPYTVVDVKLAEGPRMISRLVDCARADVRVGLPVVVEFVRRSGDVCLPVFRPRRP